MMSPSSSMRPRASSTAAERTGAWLANVAEVFRVRVEGLSDVALGEAARLPGWSRRHVLGHLHYNALVLGRLARSVAVGAPEPLGPPVDRWQAWRERSEHMPARHMRDLVVWSQEDLEAAFGELDAATRSGRIAEVPGIRVPAEDLPWLRVRELVIHLADLGGAADLERLPAGLVTRLVVDLVGSSQGGASEAARWIADNAHVPAAGDVGAYPVCLAVLSPHRD